MPEITLKVEGGNAKAHEVEAALREALAEMADPSTEVGKETAASGIDPTQLGTEVSVEEEEAGFDPFTILLIVIGGASSGAGKAIGNKAWDEILGPALKRRLGLDSIGKRKKSEDKA